MIARTYPGKSRLIACRYDDIIHLSVFHSNKDIDSVYLTLDELKYILERFYDGDVAVVLDASEKEVEEGVS